MFAAPCRICIHGTRLTRRRSLLANVDFCVGLFFCSLCRRMKSSVQLIQAFKRRSSLVVCRVPPDCESLLPLLPFCRPPPATLDIFLCELVENRTSDSVSDSDRNDRWVAENNYKITTSTPLHITQSAVSPSLSLRSFVSSSEYLSGLLFAACFFLKYELDLRRPHTQHLTPHTTSPQTIRIITIAITTYKRDQSDKNQSTSN